MNNLLVLQAADFAARKHQFQKRKGASASPYINHPIAVALILAQIGGVEDAEVLAAALLHDTIEDTETTAAELEAIFGTRVRMIVEAVSDDKSLRKDDRKRLQIDHARELAPAAVLVKLGDKISNVLDVIHRPPAGWDMARRVEYLDWAEQVILNCPRVNDALEEHFRDILIQGRALLEN